MKTTIVDLIATMMRVRESDPNPRHKKALTRALAAVKHELPLAVRDQVMTAAQNLATAQAKKASQS